MNKSFLFSNFIKFWVAGQTYVFGRFTGVVSLVLLASTYLAVIGINLKWWELIGLGLLMGLLIMVSGFLYVKFNMFKLELGAIQRENPELMEIKKDIKEIKKFLGDF